MIQKVRGLVSVAMVFDHRKNRFAPKSILWRNHQYLITQVGLHHTYYQGKTLHHIFSVSTPTLYFRLHFNTESLQWFVEEIADGNAD